MKPYLYAPVIIAGLFTLAGTATVASSELHLVRTGQQVVSMLDARNQDSVELDLRQLDANNYQKDSAQQLKDEIRLSRLSNLTPETAAPAPQIDVKATPVGEETACPKAARATRIHEHRAEREKRATSASAQYSFKVLPAMFSVPKKDAKWFFKSDKKLPVMQLAGLNVTGKDATNMRFVFNSKEFAKAMSESALVEWKERDELKKLPVYHIAIGAGPNELPQIVTIDAGKVATDAEKLGQESGTPVPDSGDQEQIVTTPNK